MNGFIRTFLLAIFVSLPLPLFSVQKEQKSFIGRVSSLYRKLKKEYMPSRETSQWIVGGGVVIFVLMYSYKRSCNDFSYDLSTPPDITIPQGPRNQPARSCLKKTPHGSDKKKAVRWKDADGDLCSIKEIPARKNKTKN